MSKEEFDNIFAEAKRINSQHGEVDAICRINRYEAFMLLDGTVTEVNRKVTRVETKSTATERIMLKTESSPLFVDVPGSTRAKKIRSTYLIGESPTDDYLFIQSSNGTVCMYRLGNNPNT